MSFFDQKSSRSRGGAHAAGGAHSPRSTASNRARVSGRAQEPEAARAAHRAASDHSPEPRSGRTPDVRAKTPKKRRRRGGIGKTLFVLFLILALLALAVVFVIKGVFVVLYALPEGGRKVELVLRGHEANKAPEPVKEGYTFIGWEDENEKLFSLKGTPLYESIVLTARMMPAFASDEHRVYLRTDENGLIRPDDRMLRGEAAEILYLSSASPIMGVDNYADVDSKASYADATSMLKALDVIPSGVFRPEDPVTLRELIEIIGQFYPVLDWPDLAVYPEGTEAFGPSTASALLYTFADISQLDPDYALFCTAASKGWIDYGPDVELNASEPLTRAQAAAFFNRVLGRGQGLQVTEDQAGKLLDLPPAHPLYQDVMEATVPHTAQFAGGQETWQSSQAFTAQDAAPGFLFRGTQMYCVGEDGYLVINDSVDGFDFGADGKFTSGNRELDELVQQTLAEITNDSMSDMEKLRAAYDYTVHNFTYIKGNHYQRGDISWAADEAYSMLSTGYGNCYNFAAVFYELARAMGQDATLISGFYGSNFLYHSWVEFTVNGERRICDPEVEYTYLDNEEMDTPDMFMMTVEFSKRWRYTP